VRERIADWKLAVSRQQQEQTIIGAAKITASLLQESAGGCQTAVSNHRASRLGYG
jgi:hypothetical protein